MAAISSSLKNNEVLPEVHRPTMRVDLFKAAIKGNNKVLIRRLGLPPEAPTEIQVTIETSGPVSQQVVAEHQDAQNEIQSTTRFGDTLLHLLITNRHNVLVLKVIAKDMSPLKAHNNKLDTPLHCAAMVGNYEVIGELIRLAPDIVRDVLKETNENGDTALHVAASNNHEGVVRELMKLNTEAAHKENKQGFSPLYIATVEGYTSVVETMLKLDGTLACTQFSDGTFPVHVAARMGCRDLVKHFLEEYPDDAMLLDRCGKNLFHVAEEQDNEELSTKVFTLTENGSLRVSQMVESMVNATDYEGNTPLHLAAMNGHRSVMRAIWDRSNHDQKALLPNKKAKTPFDLSVIQVTTANEDIGRKIGSYVKNNGSCFTREWFEHIMEPPISDKLGGIQVVGLGAVLITTVAFASAFTIPGGYNANDGTPILGRRYMYRSFVLANTLAFILAFTSVLVLIMNVWLTNDNELQLAQTLFVSAASGMVMAFGLGSYVMLAPVSMPTAVIILVVTLFLGLVSWLLFIGIADDRGKWFFCCHGRGSGFLQLIVYISPLLFIFCLPFTTRISFYCVATPTCWRPSIK